MKINQAYYQEAKERRGQLKLATVMAAEGKSPIEGPIIDIPIKQDSFDHYSLIDVVDEHEWVRLPRLDSTVVVMSKLKGQVYITTNCGTPCLSHNAPGIRQAHWYLSSNFYNAINLNMSNGWVVAGFWTLYTKHCVYDFSSPWQVFEIGDSDGNILLYNHMRIWCDKMGMDVCPPLEEVDLFYSGDRHHRVICRKEEVVPDIVTERFLCGKWNHDSTLATSNMPFGLIQCELPPPKPDSQQMKITPILKQLGLPY